jgi:parvulin-like peptidyl-prolyl isomerase
VSQPIYDGAAVKAVGYWLIEVTEKDETKGINASTMLLGSEQEANEVKNELASKNFTTMAQEYSQHESKDNGGELGWIKPGDIGSDAFDEVAFNLTLNEVSAPVKDETVQTEGGYWIVKILEKGDHGLSDDVKNQLASKRFVDWFQEQLTEGVVVNNLDENKIFWAIQKVLQGR